jgi:Tfp pilus assembly pilus retraction ATPase PilT
LTLSELLKFMAKKEASDLHLKPMRPPLLRIKGRLIPLNADALQPKDLEECSSRS